MSRVTSGFISTSISRCNSYGRDQSASQRVAPEYVKQRRRTQYRSEVSGCRKALAMPGYCQLQHTSVWTGVSRNRSAGTRQIVPSSARNVSGSFLVRTALVYRPIRALRTTTPFGAGSITGGRGPQAMNRRRTTPAFTIMKRAERHMKPPRARPKATAGRSWIPAETLRLIAISYCCANSDLLLQERDASRREPRSIVFSSVGRAPDEVVEWSLDGAQHQLLQNLGSFRVRNPAAARNDAAPDDHVQLTKRGIGSRL